MTAERDEWYVNPTPYGNPKNFDVATFRSYEDAVEYRWFLYDHHNVRSAIFHTHREVTEVVVDMVQEEVRKP
jgi:hypothetical protein